MIAEYNASNNALKTRYVHGPGVDEPIVLYEHTTLTNFTRSWYVTDQKGSITGLTTSSGTSVATNSYSHYGQPDENNVGRYGYTGQVWIEELDLYYYKARFYDPVIKRFLNTDPIGYGDGMNMYAYVGDDPVNGSDPTGTEECRETPDGRYVCDGITTTGIKRDDECPSGATCYYGDPGDLFGDENGFENQFTINDHNFGGGGPTGEQSDDKKEKEDCNEAVVELGNIVKVAGFRGQQGAAIAGIGAAVTAALAPVTDSASLAVAGVQAQFAARAAYISTGLDLGGAAIQAVGARDVTPLKDTVKGYAIDKLITEPPRVCRRLI